MKVYTFKQLVIIDVTITDVIYPDSLPISSTEQWSERTFQMPVVLTNLQKTVCFEQNVMISECISVQSSSSPLTVLVDS